MQQHISHQKGYRLYLFFALMLLPLCSQAKLMMQLSDGINQITVADSDINDMSAQSGVITRIGALGNTLFNVSVGASQSIANSNLPNLTLTHLSTFITQPTQLTLSLTQTDLTSSAAQVWLSSLSKSDNSQNSYSLSTYLDSSNTAFGMATAVSNNLWLDGSNISSGITEWSNQPVLNGPYSITMVIQMGLASGTTAQFNAVFEVAEPSALLCLLFACALLYGYRRHA